jgi:hypothetical protein
MDRIIPNKEYFLRFGDKLQKIGGMVSPYEDVVFCRLLRVG